MTPRRLLSVTALVLVAVGVALLAWSVAPDVPGVDTPATVVDDTRTGSPGNTFPDAAFMTLNDPGNVYRIEVRANEAFVIGERRSDRPDDPIGERAPSGFNAAGVTTYVWESSFVSTVDSNNPANPAQGPKEFFIRFPDADGPVEYELTVTKLPVLAQPLVWTEAMGSLLGATIGGVGLALYLLRTALPRPRPKEDVVDDVEDGSAS